MATNDPSSAHDKLVPIRQAAEILGVSVDTVRRWEAKGLLSAHRSEGGHRLFSVADLNAYQRQRPLSVSEAAAEMGVSSSTLRRYEDSGLISPTRNGNGERIYTRDQLHELRRQLESVPAVADSPLSSKVAPERPVVPVKPAASETIVVPQKPLKHERRSPDPIFVKPLSPPHPAHHFRPVASSLPAPAAPTRQPEPLAHRLLSGVVTSAALVLVLLVVVVTGAAHWRLFDPEQSKDQPLHISGSGVANSDLAAGTAAIGDVSGGRVLALTDQQLDQFFEINVPTLINKEVQIVGPLTLNGDVTGTDINVDVGAGTVTASNLVYSLQGQTGDVTLQAGDGISINGTTISNTAQAANAFGSVVVGSSTAAADQTDDTLTVKAGSNITLSLDSATDALTINAADSNTYTAGNDLTLSGSQFSVDSTLNHVTTINGLTGADGTTENTIEGLIFDSDAQTISGTWTVADEGSLVAIVTTLGKGY